MWDRVIEVFACYGAVALFWFGTTRFGMKNSSSEQQNSALMSGLTGWTYLTLGAGAVYVIAGPILFN